MTKLIIEVSGGTITNIQATEPTEIYIIDHDNLKERGGDCELDTVYAPDKIIQESDIEGIISGVIENYK